MNILIDIAKEEENAYCVSSETIQIAIDRGFSKAHICIAIVDILAGDTGGFYMEDKECCAFVALNNKQRQTGRRML